MNDKVLEVVKDEYEKLWNYYIQGVQERFKLFDWYFKIVTLPFTILASLTFLGNSKDIINDYNTYFGLILLAIFLCGLCIYVIYAKQNALTVKYDIAINKIREFYRTNIPELEKVLVIDTLRSSKGKFNGMGSVKLWRGLIIVFFNSIILTSSFSILVCISNVFVLIGIYLVFVIVHIVVYRIMNINYINIP